MGESIIEQFTANGDTDNSLVCAACHYGGPGVHKCLIVANRNGLMHTAEPPITTEDEARRIIDRSDSITIKAEHPIPGDCPKQLVNTFLSAAAKLM